MIGETFRQNRSFRVSGAVETPGNLENRVLKSCVQPCKTGTPFATRPRARALIERRFYSASEARQGPYASRWTALATVAATV
jgi:hypothetical protein